VEPFVFERAADVESAVAVVAGDPSAAFIAGGTEMVNWLKEGIAAPRRLVDITGLGLNAIEITRDGLSIGALMRMSDVAAHPEVRARFPGLAEALEAGASPQLRNMATIGGNLMQRTRCPYFRAEFTPACNKRIFASGCSAGAPGGINRTHSIFGWSEHCAATHSSDLAVMLAALDAYVRIRGTEGERSMPLVDFYRLPGNDPMLETELQHGELIVGVDVPLTPVGARLHYLKVRERASYEFALVSAAGAVTLIDAGRRLGEVRLALGAVAPKPWRMRSVEWALRGARVDEIDKIGEAVERGFAEARPLAQNGFKVELAIRAAVRVLMLSAKGPWT